MGITIADKRKKPLEIAFSSLSIGTAFQHGRESRDVYIKTHPAESESVLVNSVSVLSGKFCFFGLDLIVYPVQTTLHIDSNITK